jgi:hypothetical protein
LNYKISTRALGIKVPFPKNSGNKFSSQDIYEDEKTSIFWNFSLKSQNTTS